MRSITTAVLLSIAALSFVSAGVNAMNRDDSSRKVSASKALEAQTARREREQGLASAPKPANSGTYVFGILVQ